MAPLGNPLTIPRAPADSPSGKNPQTRARASRGDSSASRTFWIAPKTGLDNCPICRLQVPVPYLPGSPEATSDPTPGAVTRKALVVVGNRRDNPWRPTWRANSPAAETRRYGETVENDVLIEPVPKRTISSTSFWMSLR